MWPSLARFFNEVGQLIRKSRKCQLEPLPEPIIRMERKDCCQIADLTEPALPPREIGKGGGLISREALIHIETKQIDLPNVLLGLSSKVYVPKPLARRERQDRFGGMHFLKRQGDGNSEDSPTFMAFDDVFDDRIDVAAGIKLLMRPMGKREEGTLKGLRCQLALEPVVDMPIAPKSLTAPRKT